MRSLAHLFNETLSLYKQSEVSGGNVGETFDFSFTFKGRVQPIDAKENIKAGRKTHEDTYRVYCSPSENIDTKDQIERDSLRYRIVEKHVYPNTYMEFVMMRTRG